MSVDGTFQKLTKKEVLGLNREKEKLELALGGIKDMPGLPSAIFVIDAQKENISVLEANKLGIPVVAVTDTNADPSDVDFVVPGNDDSIKAISLFTSGAAEACLSGKRRAKDRRNEDTKEGHVKEGSFLDDHGHKVEIEKR
jgi:small subunit ribosomal protein S2